MKNNKQLSQPLDNLLAVSLRSRKNEELRQTTRDSCKFMLAAFMRFMLDNGAIHGSHASNKVIEEIVRYVSAENVDNMQACAEGISVSN